MIKTRVIGITTLVLLGNSPAWALVFSGQASGYGISGFELLGVGSGTEPFSLPLSAPELFPLELPRSLPLALPTEGEGPCKREIERMRLTKCNYHSLTAIPN